MTKETKESKMAYSAMAGELRKGARLYEVFKSASDAATILANFEKEEEATKRRISLLSKELEKLDLECDIAYNKAKEAEESEKAAQVNAGGIVQRAKKEAERITAKASTVVSETKEKALLVLSEIEDKTKKATSDMNISIVKKNDALSSLAKVEKQIQNAKDKFLDTLG